MRDVRRGKLELTAADTENHDFSQTYSEPDKLFLESKKSHFESLPCAR